MVACGSPIPDDSARLRHHGPGRSDIDPAALAPRAAVAVRLRRRATGEVVAGQTIALLETGRDVALVRAGGMIPMILRQALQAL